MYLCRLTRGARYVYQTPVAECSRTATELSRVPRFR